MTTQCSLTVDREPTVIDTPISAEKHSAKIASESSAKVMNAVLRVLEGIGLIFANIITLGLINFVPAIDSEYQKVFGGKQIEVMKDAEIDTTPDATDPVDTQESDDEAVSTNPVPEVTAPQESSVTKKPETLLETGKEPETLTKKEGTPHGWRQATTKNAEWIIDKTKEGVSYSWSQINSDNAQKVYETATDPKNIKKTLGAVGVVFAGVLGVGIYSYSGGNTEALVDTALNITTNGTPV